VLSAYRDALRATLGTTKTFSFDNKKLRLTEETIRQFGMHYDLRKNRIGLVDTDSALKLKQLEKVYALDLRRKIPDLPMDRVLAKRMYAGIDQQEIVPHYQSEGQKVAIRTALLSPEGSTVVVNLPTGTGKTMVAHSLCLFAPVDKLTIVIVPTTALAIEQASRVRMMLQEAGEQTHSNYFFGADLTPQERQDVKDRIRNGQQRILFASPESARGALLPSLFDAARDRRLAHIVVDEAHIVDQWGDDFRPDFQIFAAVTHALIKSSKGTIRCLLLSATFTDTNLATLRSLFKFEDGEFLEIHGSFLRPEPQYDVRQVYSNQEAETAFSQALVELPRPMIVYALERDKANAAFKKIKNAGYSRVACFTGKTTTLERHSIIQRWNDNELDIIVATSAFGVGMDKSDVKSILHIQPPENIDRYYQEVGRGGRDGRACQALVLFQYNELSIAESINTSRLITIETGLIRWLSLFEHRTTDSSESLVNISTKHEGISRSSQKNESWNWRTLLLMQRSGLIEIEFERPETPPSWATDSSPSEFNALEKQFYEDYYQKIKVTIVQDQHRTIECWERFVDPQRTLELSRRQHGFNVLRDWLLRPTEQKLCNLLGSHYTVSGVFPQITCGGCPCCALQNDGAGYFPTLNGVTEVLGLNTSYEFPDFVYYDFDASVSTRAFVRAIADWVQFHIESKKISAIYSSAEILNRLTAVLPVSLSTFWCDETLMEGVDIDMATSSIIIVPPGQGWLPKILYTDNYHILLAPKDIPSDHFGRKWRDDYRGATSLANFMPTQN
jgi:ATP-dependent DNA helicase RecQ